MSIRGRSRVVPSYRFTGCPPLGCAPRPGQRGKLPWRRAERLRVGGFAAPPSTKRERRQSVTRCTPAPGEEALLRQARARKARRPARPHRRLPLLLVGAGVEGRTRRDGAAPRVIRSSALLASRGNTERSLDMRLVIRSPRPDLDPTSLPVFDIQVETDPDRHQLVTRSHQRIPKMDVPITTARSAQAAIRIARTKCLP